MTQTPHSKQLILPYFAICTSILALSTSALFIRWANAPGPVTGFYRMAIAALLLTPFALVRILRNKSFDAKFLIYPLIGGIFSGLDLGTWAISLNFTSAANATLLGNTAPLWVALASMLFFGQRLSKKFWAGLVLALTGAALIIGSDFFLHPRFSLGDLIALSTGFFYAGYYIFTERGRRHLDTLTHIWGVVISASITLYFFNFFLGNPLTGYPARTYLLFIATALISQILGYLSSAYALGHLPASVVSVTMIGQPVMTAILAIPLLGEIPGPMQILGSLVALAGIYIANLAYTKLQNPTPVIQA
jgi:drug/metabolite transporter (DMT)-like permease